MPLYEYECTQCKRHTEKIQKFSDAEITTCPHCGGLLRRVITAPAIAFKGSGWYKDLYSSPKPAAAASSSSDGSNTESKPATSDTASAAPASSNTPTPSTPAPAAAPASAPAKPSS